MSKQLIEVTEDLEGSGKSEGEKDRYVLFDNDMARMWIDLLTRATLYAGAIGLIAGIAAALFFGD